MMIPLILFAALPALAAGKPVGDVIDDNWIHTKLKAELVARETHDINIEVHNGVVLLAGFVETQGARESIVERAKAIEGVVEVSDQLHHQPMNRMAGGAVDDHVIAGKVKAELASDTATDAFEINVEVRAGTVLLSGFVDDAAEANHAIRIARAVEGVDEVINGMETAAG